MQAQAKENKTSETEPAAKEKKAGKHTKPDQQEEKAPAIQKAKTDPVEE